MKLTDEDGVKKSVELARFFHETYERFAPDFDYKTREASAVKWEDVPQNNQSLMIAVASEVYKKYLAETETALEAEREKNKAFEENPLLRIDPDGSVHVIECEKCSRYKTAMYKIMAKIRWVRTVIKKGNPINIVINEIEEYATEALAPAEGGDDDG